MFHPNGTRILASLALWVLPWALLVRWLAFRWPGWTERVYGARVYPVVAGVLGSVNGLIPFSLAEAAAVFGLVAAAVSGWRMLRRWRSLDRSRMAWALVRGGWIGAGLLVAVFLLVWGLNYARPSMATRMRLELGAIAAEEVLRLGRIAARAAREAHTQLGQPTGAPTTRPGALIDLDRAIDHSLRRLALPGDVGGPSPVAKPLWSSALLSRLGISGIFIPFTGEPSFNAMLPDASLPIVIAHEKAHQRGVANEGEASLVGVLACVAADHPYARYAGLLYLASRTIGAAARYRPDEARDAWQGLGPGPLADLAAEREFWARYEGPAREVANRVNDAYLRSNRVPGGVESYAQVVRLLVGARRGGWLELAAAEQAP